MSRATRRLGPQDVNDRTYVCIWDAMGLQPLDKGHVVAYQESPTVIIEREDGSTKSWSTSLPWHELAPILPTEPGSVILHAGCLLMLTYSHTWNCPDHGEQRDPTSPHYPPAKVLFDAGSTT